MRLRDRIFPRLYDGVMALVERGELGDWRRDVVAPARGRVLGIATGTGADFPHFSAGTFVVATDPDLHMLARARTRVGESQGAIVLVAADAEALPFAAASFDDAVVTLAMCTIPDPVRALGELQRVVRSGQPVRFLEHVRVHHPLAARVQSALTPAWRRVAGGCHLDRDTVAALRASGLAVEALTTHAGGLFVAVTARVREGGRRRGAE